MRATAIVPVKRFDAAKQRLAETLAPAARARLAAAMVTDVLGAIGRCESIERTLVVSREPALTAIAATAGAELLAEPDERGHSAAALLGVGAALEAGAEAAALLPGDCPLLEPRELDGALGTLRKGTVGVIADRHRTGTNGLLLSPPDAIEPSFGPGSCERHLRAAATAGVRATVLELPSLALDLDTGADLDALEAAIARMENAPPATAAALAELRSGPGRIAS